MYTIFVEKETSYFCRLVGIFVSTSLFELSQFKLLTISLKLDIQFSDLLPVRSTMTTPQRPSTTCRRPSELFRQEKNKTKFSINQSINYQIALSFGVTYSKKKKFMYRASRINFYYIIQNKIRA